MSRERGSLTLTIDDATDYFTTCRGAGDRRQSQPVKLCGLDWHMTAARFIDGDDVRRLGVFVHCFSDDDADYNCKATCMIRVRNAIVRNEMIGRLRKEFSHATPDAGCIDFLSIDVSCFSVPHNNGG